MGSRAAVPVLLLLLNVALLAVQAPKYEWGFNGFTISRGGKGVAVVRYGGVEVKVWVVTFGDRWAWDAPCSLQEQWVESGGDDVVFGTATCGWGDFEWYVSFLNAKSGVVINYTFKARRDLTFEDFDVRATLPAAYFAGRTIYWIDAAGLERPVTLPATYTKPSLGPNLMGFGWVLPFTEDAGLVVTAFCDDSPNGAYLGSGDERQWANEFSVMTVLLPGPAPVQLPLKAGGKYTIYAYVRPYANPCEREEAKQQAVRIFSALRQGRRASEVVAELTGAPPPPPPPASPPAGEFALVRFYIPWDDSVESATSVKYWVSSWDRKVERVVVGSDGRFYAGGRRIRFFGVNIGGAACFPSKPDAERIAARLEKLGVNLVRLHGIDANWDPINIFGGYALPTTRQLDPVALDRLDYFIAKLRERGIYVNLNLLVARRFRAADGLHSDIERMDWKDQHALIFIDPQVRELHKEFIRAILTHRNPYTNMTYAEDPAIAFVEIANEMGTWFWYMLTDLVARLPPYYKGLLEERWNQYLVSKYGSIGEYLNRWGVKGDRAPALTGSMYWSAPVFVREDWLDFIYRLELEAYSELYDFIKREVGYQGIVIGSTTFFSPLSIQSQFDIIDAHSYWQHPEFPSGSWDPANWYVLNEPMVNQPLKSTIASLAAYRVHGKPFVVSEYGHPAPNMYAPEGTVLIAAYAALQDWDGIIYFAYGSLNDWDARRIRGWFDIDQDPLKMALMIPAYMLFVRGDVEPARDYVVANLPDNVERRLLRDYNYGEGSDVGIKPEIALMHRVAVATKIPPPSEAVEPKNVKLPAEAAKGFYKSDTGQIVWDATTGGKGLLTVRTNRSILLAGYIGGRSFDYGSISLEVGRTVLDGWGIVSLIVHENETIDSWSRMLLIATGYGGNEGMTIRDYDTKKELVKITTGVDSLGWTRGKRIYCPFLWGHFGDWGRGPTLVEPLTLTVRVRARGNVEVWALDNAGRRSAKVPVTAEGEYLVFRITPKYETIWFEITEQAQSPEAPAPPEIPQAPPPEAPPAQQPEAPQQPENPPVQPTETPSAVPPALVWLATAVAAAATIAALVLKYRRR